MESISSMFTWQGSRDQSRRKCWHHCLSHTCAASLLPSLPPSQLAGIPTSISGLSPPPGLLPHHSRLLPLISLSSLCHTFLCFLFPCRLSPRLSWANTHTHTHTHAHTLRVPFSFPFFNKPFLPFHSLTDLWLLSLRSGLKIHFLFLYRLDISSKKKKKKTQKGPEKLPDQRWGRTEQGGSIQPLNFLLQWAWRFRCREFGQTGLIYLFLLHLSSLVFRLLLQAGAPFPPRSQTTGPSSPWRREHV